VSAVSQFSVGVVLARLLTPADFGIAALTYVALGFAQPLSDLGTAAAVVQRPALTDRHVRTAFTCSVIVGCAIAILVAIVAPIVATVMRDTRVVPVLRALSLGIVLRSAAAIAGALLRRALDFKRLFVIETTSYLAGFAGVAITLAARGYGVWSLVWGGLAQILLASAGQLLSARHAMRPLLARRELGDLLAFGLAAAFSSGVNYIALNGDYFLVGRLMGAFDLGLYTRAYLLMNLPHTYAAGIISGVMFPAFAQAQGDLATVRRGFLAVTRLTAMIAAPAMAILAVVAPHLVHALYGPAWTGAIVPLQILAAAGYFRALYHLGGVTAQSVGQVYGELTRQLLYAAAIVAATLAGSAYGLAGVALGVTAAIVLMFVMTTQLALRATETSLSAYLDVQRSALTTAVLSGAVALIIRLALEGLQRPSIEITVLVSAAAATPWYLAIKQLLRQSSFEPLQAALPRWIT